MTDPRADMVVQITTDPERADQVVRVVADQVITATPDDAGKVLQVAADGTLELVDQDLAGTYAPLDALTPVQVRKSDVSLSLSTTSGQWADVDPDGSAAARPLDLVFSDCEVGQWVRADINAAASTGTSGVALDVWTVVGGVARNQFAASTVGLGAWFMANGAAPLLTGGASRRLTADDIEPDGTVRLRLRSRNAGTSGRSILAASGSTFIFEGRGPFGPGA